MYFQIQKVVLWPRNQKFEPRTIDFSLGKVNVISGSSRTGKSAVIPIIDYCLGSDKCTIPVNTIRDNCAWFGIVIQLDGRQMLLARKTPDRNQRMASEMYVLEGENVTIPSTIEDSNDTSSSVKRNLDELAGLSRLETDTEVSQSGFNGRPSFRDMMAFNFQPQNIVANPDVFFYKADTHEHREKLKAIFPYVLGAVTPGILVKQYELSQLERELYRKTIELRNIQGASQEWISEVEVNLSRARELGLLPSTFQDDGRWGPRLTALRTVVERADHSYEITEAAIAAASKELAELEQAEGELAVEASSYRSRLAKMEQLRDAASMYSQSLYVQRDRLKVSQWLKSVAQEDRECPMCGSGILEAKPLGLLDNLVQSLEEIERTTMDFKVVPAAIDREYSQIRAKLKETVEKLRGVQLKQRQLEQTSSEARQRRYDLASVSRFIGNLDRALNVYDRLGNDRDLQLEVRRIQERIGAIRREIDPERIRERIRQAIWQIVVNASRLVLGLDAEDPHAPLSFSIKDLNVTIGNGEGANYLWEIGSGSNWLAYHLAVSLGWQQLFSSAKSSPVPSFLVYDQPSQVYFPKKLMMDEEEPGYRDEDVEAVRKIFRTLSQAVADTDGRLQVIVLDHAPSTIWGNEEHVVEIGEWRGKEKLVPLEWITETV